MKLNVINSAIFLISLLLLCTIGYRTVLFADQMPLYESSELIVTARRIPTTFSDLMRTVVVIDRDEIESAPVHTIQDMLEYAIGVDVMQRGPMGIQADISIRGATFEQTLILINGTKVNDPQTGHHNLDIPLSLNDVERIEILKGHGSRLYGPNAFGGVINIITREHSNKNATFTATIGDYGTLTGSVSFFYPIGSIGQNLSFSGAKSSGYRYNTDFEKYKISYDASAKLGSVRLRLFSGYIDKRFGANGFYSDAFPDQWEHTEAVFCNAVSTIEGAAFSISPELYWRRHTDEFLLDRADPDFYKNTHTTDIFGGKIQAKVASNVGITAFGCEIGAENIRSSNLNDHKRTRGGMFVEHNFLLWKLLTITPGGFAYNYADWGWQISPGIDLGLQLTKQTRLFATIGQSFRVPTFTELYYNSPVNMGNPNLKPEEALTYEIGLNWRERSALGMQISAFRREGKNLIDWVRADTSEPWQAQNITEISTDGLELNFAISPSRIINGLPIVKISTSYAFLHHDESAGTYESKYVLNILKHQFLLDVKHELPFGVLQNWRIRFEDRENYGRHIVIDTKLSFCWRSVELFAELTNLFNTYYEEVGSIPMPGRWAFIGANLRPVFTK